MLLLFYNERPQIPTRKRTGRAVRGMSAAEVRQEHYAKLRDIQREYNEASLRLQERAVVAEERRIGLLEALLNRMQQ